MDMGRESRWEKDAMTVEIVFALVTATVLAAVIFAVALTLVLALGISGAGEKGVFGGGRAAWSDGRSVASGTGAASVRRAAPNGPLTTVLLPEVSSLPAWGSLSGWCRTNCGSCSSGWCRRRRRGLRAAADVATVIVRCWRRSCS
ncbi:DUF6332 family protein [Streptomyces sp. NPDC052107]|uniref:DUF6332 family protein n=1 Tax=Streptomyces sp. NPDC052107 TaxID=3155632 RepID=UPI003446CD37